MVLVGFAGQAVGQGNPAPTLSATFKYKDYSGPRPGQREFDIGANCIVTNWPADSTLYLLVEVQRKDAAGNFNSVGLQGTGGSNGSVGTPSYQATFQQTVYPPPNGGASRYGIGTYRCRVSGYWRDKATGKITVFDTVFTEEHTLQ